MNHKKAATLVVKDIKALGYTAVPQKKTSSNGADIEVWTGKKGYKVEVKVAKRMTRGGWQIAPLDSKNADVVAIVLPKGRIIYSSIKDHERVASVKGWRGVSDYIKFFNN